MKVSFIVPVYNAEKYLTQCAESLLAQTYKDFEIILVDDGSPDGCPALCDKLSARDSRIKTVHRENGGLSRARNTGLSESSGDYVIFVDSDDFWIGKDSLSKLMTTIDNNPECDFISFNCSYYYQDSNAYKKWVAYNKELEVPVDKNTAMRSLVASGTMPMSAWLKVISKKSLSDINLQFIPDITAEDIPWFVDLLDGTKKCMFVNDYVYAYRQNVAGSITTKGGDKSFKNLLNIIKKEIKKMESRSFSAEAKDALYSFLAYEFCILLSSAHKMPKELCDELLQYKWLLNYTDNPKVRKAAFINKYFGIRITEYVLRFYLQHIRK